MTKDHEFGLSVLQKIRCAPTPWCQSFRVWREWPNLRAPSKLIISYIQRSIVGAIRTRDLIKWLNITFGRIKHIQFCISSIACMRLQVTFVNRNFILISELKDCATYFLGDYEIRKAELNCQIEIQSCRNQEKVTRCECRVLKNSSNKKEKKWNGPVCSWID